MEYEEFMEQGNPICCGKCGFLAVTDRKIGGIAPAALDIRTASGHADKNELVCYKLLRSYTPRQEIYEASRNPGGAAASPRHAELLNTCQCNKFTQWIPHYSPKEHAEIAFAEQREKGFRDWQENRDKEDHKWREGESKNADNRHRKTLVFAILAAFIGSSAVSRTIDYFFPPKQPAATSQPTKIQQGTQKTKTAKEEPVK